MCSIALVRSLPWNTEYCFEFVIPYTRSKILIPPNTKPGSLLGHFQTSKVKVTIIREELKCLARENPDIYVYASTHIT